MILRHAYLPIGRRGPVRCQASQRGQPPPDESLNAFPHKLDPPPSQVSQPRCRDCFFLGVRRQAHTGVGRQAHTGMSGKAGVAFFPGAWEMPCPGCCVLPGFLNGLLDRWMGINKAAFLIYVIITL